MYRFLRMVQVMSSFGSWFWGTSKSSAHAGWLVTLAGGFGMGAGLAIIFVTRIFVEVIPTLNPNIQINPEAYANLQLMGMGIFFLGLLVCLFGFFVIHRSLKTETGKPMVSISMEKKYCRYCGTENKSDAVFCEKCGKAIK